MKRLVALALFGPALLACGEGVPSDPTYFADVAPILGANCARCHGADPYVEKLSVFRLDRYVKNDDQTDDAWDYRDLIIDHAVDLEPPAMPLDYPLTDRQREILARWVANGAPKGERDNVAPTAVLLEPADAAMTADQELALTLRSWDEDGDGLAIAIGYREVGSSSSDLLLTGVGGGLRELVVDTGQLASTRTFEFFAIVDDGYADDPAANAHEVKLLGQVLVDHGARGTAPSVVLLSPNGGATVIGTTNIAWSASDPDVGDVLTIDLELLTVDADGVELSSQPIATGLANDPPTYAWDHSGVPTSDGNGQSITYRIRVTATDAGAKNTRSDVSDANFTIAEEMCDTNLTWDDVRPTFVTYCSKCHGQPARTPALEYFRLDKYDQADAGGGDLGVYEQRSLVYERLVATGQMPPAVEEQPSQAQIDDIAEWILACAPRSAGPVDGVPTVMWNSPNNAAITKVTMPTVNLSWTAADPEGGALTGGIAYAPLNAAADQLAFCDATVTGWIDIAGADIEAGAFGWTIPSQGYFCLRAQATDAASQSTTVIAGRPVKYTTTGPGPP